MNEVRHNSKKRTAIYEALCETKEHPSAEMLYAKLKEIYPELSLGTVYRNLGQLCRDGMVISVGTVEGQERYDATVTPHPHFVCRGCRRVIDLELPDTVSKLGRLVEREEGCAVESCSLTFSGLCGVCRK